MWGLWEEMGTYRSVLRTHAQLQHPVNLGCGR